MGNGQDLIDSSMLDLFRTEVDTHAAILKDSLLALENDPSAFGKLEALIRAAHSIKGSARIVELDQAVRIAHCMEDCLVAAQRGEVSLGSEQIHILLKDVDILTQISNALGEGLEGWLTQHQAEIDRVVSATKGILKGEGETPPAPLPREPVVKKEDKPSSPPREQRKQRETVPKAVIADASMLDLFLTEVETHVAILNDGLLVLENDPSASDKLEALMRAAHSIKGAARIVELDQVVKLAHSMEDCFVAAQRGEVLLGSEQIDILLKSADILTQIANALEGDLQDWLAQHEAEIDRLIANLALSLKGESPEPEPPKAASQVEEPAPPPSLRPTTDSALAHPGDREERAVTEKVAEARPYYPESDDKDRMVRVTAGKIERLMGQAGEVVVSARWLPPFSASLLELKKSHIEIFKTLEGLKEAVERKQGIEEVSGLLLDAREKVKECSLNLADRLNELEMFTSTTASLSDRLYHEVIGVRMRPFADGVGGFPRLVRDLAKELGKKVRLDIVGKSTEVDRDILEKLDAPLNHLLRNAVDHGIEPPDERLAAGKPETGRVRLEAVHRSGMLMIMVADDGRGVDLDKLRQKILRKEMVARDMVDKLTEPELMDFLFLPGFSTADNVTEISGRGVGLDVVRNMVHEVGGVVRAVSKPGEGLSFQMELPLTLSVVRTFLVEIGGEPYAFPLARIDRCLVLSQQDIHTVEDRQYFEFDNDNISLLNVHDVLGTNEPAHHEDRFHVVVVSDRLNSYGLLVDKFLGEYDLVVRPLDPRLGKVPDISAVAVMLDGSPVLIFDVEDLVRSIDNLLAGRRLRKVTGRSDKVEVKKQKSILVVDDSITVREMERKLLENKGYRVEIAVDGLDGWNAVRTGDFDLVVSDVDMPRMNGIELITNIKNHAALKSLPVIIISYKDKEEDRLGGLEAGANYYLTKGSFQDDSFIDAVVDLIGEA
ncbi:MAG: Hpt domain-containing protein [Pseudomonadota bacterium]